MRFIRIVPSFTRVFPLPSPFALFHAKLTKIQYFFLAFDHVHRTVGMKAMDNILPNLIASLEASDEKALPALKELFAVRAQALLPDVLPHLTVIPVSRFNAKAITAIIQASKQPLGRKSLPILSALIDSLFCPIDAENRDEILVALDVLYSSTTQPDDAHLVMVMLFELTTGDEKKKLIACQQLARMCQNNKKVDYSGYVKEWMFFLLEMLASPNVEMQEAAVSGLGALIANVPKEEYCPLVFLLNTAIETASRSGEIAGFNVPKAVTPMISIYLQGLLTGSPEVREFAAHGIKHLLENTRSQILQPHVTQLAGPLIRVLGEKVAPNVKEAILDTFG